MRKKQYKSGFVSLIGRTNTGKSTLLNALVNNKISIVSNIPQTTRHVIRGVLHLPAAQVVFVDTPGMSLLKKGFAVDLNHRAHAATEGVDVLYYVVDVQRPPQQEEQAIMRFIRQQNIPTIMALNKRDRGKGYCDEYIQQWQVMKGESQCMKYFIPISAIQQKNLEELLKATLDLLPLGQPYYPKETVTDFPLELRIAEIIREKFFQRIQEEIPYSLAVVTESISDEGSIVRIQATVYVNTFSQKKIVIGNKGSLIKEVGTEARKELQNIVKKKIFLELWVKVLSDWQDSPRVLREMGFEEEEEDSE